jgi:chloramphenicol O-acetyltransferase type B
MKWIAYIFIHTQKIIDRVLMYIYKPYFASAGRNVIFSARKSHFSYKTISVGNNVGIGEGAFFSATRSHIYIGNNIAFAPNVTIRGGNHRYDIVGKWITDYKDSDKKPTDDESVHIEDDCWIASNVIILKGVTIGRGSIVAAGAIVNKSTPPYSIVGGIPAKVLKFRWNNVKNIMEHEEILYPENMRLSRERLEESFTKYAKTK